MMVEARKEPEKTETPGTGEQASFAETSARLLAEQASAMTMMTAVGFSVATQFAGAFMGAFADSLDKSRSHRAEKPAQAKAPEADIPAVTPEKKNVVPLKVVKAPSAPRTDDLKRISGIGPKLEKALNDMGVRTFADIAKWNDTVAGKIDEKLGLDNRISRDGWVKQAKALLEG